MTESRHAAAMQTANARLLTDFTSTSELILPGASRSSLDTRVRSGELVRVRRGAYANARQWDEHDGAQRHLLLVASTLRPIGDPMVLSHRSAAVAHGIPFLGGSPDRVEVTMDRTRTSRTSRHLLVHTAKHIPSAMEYGDWLITTPARTAIDIARSMDFASGLMAVNDVLHRGLASEEQLLAEIDQLATKAAPRRALDVVERADARVETAGESVSLARMYQLDVPIPDLQVSFEIEPGIVDRPDFVWEDPLRFGEFDGEVKYQRGAFGTNDTLEMIVRREKVREDRLRRRAVAVGRWTWIDALRVDGLIRELRRIDVLKGRHKARFGLFSANGLW